MDFIHKEYPKVLHKPGGLVSPEVHSDEARDALIADGWSLRPVVEQEPETESEYVAVAEPDGGVVLPAPKKKRRP